MEQWTYNRTYSGVPQGAGVSPVLANVYLHELDKFMEEYAQKYKGDHSDSADDFPKKSCCTRLLRGRRDITADYTGWKRTS